MNNRMVIIGAGGHGKVIADIALKNGYSNISFVDDRTIDDCMGFPVVGKIAVIEALNDGQTDFVIGIGNNSVRKEIAERFAVNWVSLVHPSAQIGTGVHIAPGTVVMANAIVNVCTTVGRHCIINTGSVVEHDNCIGDYVHISPRAALGGTVFVGEQTHIGIGAIIKNNLKICRDCTIGAGAVVIRNIENGGTFVGVPAKMI